VAAIARAAPSPMALGAEIGFQIHSMNDLREWDALLRKGWVYAKVDPNWSMWVGDGAEGTHGASRAAHGIGAQCLAAPALYARHRSAW
jgi:hypothetical protein